jgi:hypothetical protein
MINISGLVHNASQWHHCHKNRLAASKTAHTLFHLPIASSCSGAYHPAAFLTNFSGYRRTMYSG